MTLLEDAINLGILYESWGRYVCADIRQVWYELVAVMSVGILQGSICYIY